MAPQDATSGGPITGSQQVPTEGSGGKGAGSPKGELNTGPTGASAVGGGEIQDIPTDVESMMRRRLAQVQAQAAQVTTNTGPDHGQTPMHPVSTRFDTVTDHTDVENKAAYAALVSRVQSIIAPLVRKLERILKAEERSKWITERERGQISTRHLAQLVSSPGYRTPFKEQQRQEVKDLAISLVVDLSGSYCAVCGHRECEFSQRAGGEKLVLSRDAVVAMGEVLTKLEIPHEIVGFNSVRESRLPAGNPQAHLRWTERTAFHVYKDFETESLEGLTAMEAGRQNPTGEAVLWAAERLSAEDASRKILIVLSNGVPTSVDQPEAVMIRHLQHAITTAEGAGIEVFGIGIQDDRIPDLFPRHVLLQGVDELPTVAAEQLGRLIIDNARQGPRRQQRLQTGRRGRG